MTDFERDVSVVLMDGVSEGLFSSTLFSGFEEVGINSLLVDQFEILLIEPEMRRIPICCFL